MQKVCRESGTQAEAVGKVAVPVLPSPDRFFQTDHSDQAHTGHTSRCRKTNLPDVLEELSSIERISALRSTSRLERSRCGGGRLRVFLY